MESNRGVLLGMRQMELAEPDGTKLEPLSVPGKIMISFYVAAKQVPQCLLRSLEL